MNADTAFPGLGIKRPVKWYLHILCLVFGIKKGWE